MISVSNDYHRQLIAGNRRWLVRINMTLADGTTLALDNNDIWEGGVTIDEAISSDSSFDIGSAIISSLEVVINNITENFSQYDFFDAKLVLWLGVEGDKDENDVQRYYRKGFYVVDVPSYNGSLITLKCLDNMTWFDVPFEEVTGISYPAYAGTVVQAICQHVGVTLGTPNFPNYEDVWTRILASPEQKLSCREVLQYIAQMCCCYCKINTAGQLVLNWYNKDEILGITNYDGGTYHTTTTPYSDGVQLDGGHFNPWDGDSADGGTFQDLLDTVWISNNFQIEVSTDNVVVTGCRVRNNASKESAYDVLWVDTTVEADHERYVLVIDSNPFIVDETKAAHIANIVGQTLAGLPIRGFKASSLADFCYETGDMATIVDFRGNRYYSWITSFTFTTNISEDFSCGVQSVKMRSEQRFSTIAETFEKAKVAITAYDNAVKALNELAQNSIDYSEYVYPVGAGVGTARTMWRYNGTSVDTTTPNNPKFPDSTVVFKIAGDGVFVSTSKDEQGYEIFSNGYDANSGTAILNTLYAKGISCDSIHSGTLTLGGADNKDGWLQILNASGGQIGKWDKDGILAKSGKIQNGSGTFEVVLSNGDIKGAAISGSSFYLKADGDIVDISGGRLKTQGTWIQLCESLDDPDLRHLALGNQYSAYINEHSGSEYQRTIGSKWIIEAAYNASQGSDKRLKRKIKDIPKELSIKVLSKLKPVSFYYKSNGSDTLKEGKRYGFIAQDVRKILDGVGEKDAYLEHSRYDEEDTRTIEYRDCIAHIVNVVQSQQSEIDTLKQELADLKAKVK